MSAKSGLVLLTLLLVIGVFGLIQAQRIGARIQARQQLINSLENDTPNQSSLIQQALTQYALNHSLLSFSKSLADTTTDRCRILDNMATEEIAAGGAHLQNAQKIQSYAAKSGC